MLAVLTTRARLEERMIFDALERRGVAYEAVDDRTLVEDLQAGPAKHYSGVFNRIMSHTRSVYAARLFEASGHQVLNSSQVVESCGRLLSKVNDRDAAETLIEHKQALKSPAHNVYYVQELIDKPGRDIRVIVLGDRVAAAVYRRSEHWITNTARGATTERCDLTPDLVKLSLQAAEAVGGGMLAVDLIERSTGELLVTEVNHTMEFHGLAAVADVDIADLIVEHVQEVLLR